VDNSDPAPVVTVSVLSPFGSAVTVTNNTFRPTVTGEFTVTYRAEDVSGNFSTRVFTIDVIEEPVEEPADNTLLIVLGAVGGVALVGGGTFYFLKKKPSLK
jgi:LPXTG-motif cell wall-anchored protein